MAEEAGAATVRFTIGDPTGLTDGPLTREQFLAHPAFLFTWKGRPPFIFTRAGTDTHGVLRSKLPAEVAATAGLLWPITLLSDAVERKLRVQHLGARIGINIAVPMSGAVALLYLGSWLSGNAMWMPTAVLSAKYDRKEVPSAAASAN